MKIAYIHTSAMPAAAANTIQVAKMCSALRALDHHVLLLIPGRRRDFGEAPHWLADLYGVSHSFPVRTVYQPPIPGRERFFAACAAVHLLRAGSELVLTRSATCAATCAGMGLRVVLEMHEPLDNFRKPVRRRFRRLLRSPRMLKLVLITEALRRAYERDAPEAASRMMVLPDGADPAPDDLRAIPLDRAAGRLAVGYVGSLNPGKGMEIISRLAPLCPWADFHVVGGGDAEVRRWKSRAAYANLVFHGRVPHREAGRYIGAFDVLLLPNQEFVAAVGGSNIGPWTSPLKLFEYMAHGCAILCSDIDVLREVVEDGENALLCRSDDPEVWAAALRRLRDDDVLRKRLGRTAKHDFNARYTWSGRAAQLVEGIQTEI